MIHASTSAMAAEDSDSWPSRVWVMPRSLRMRAMIGKAVIDIAAAMNSANGQKPTPAGASEPCSSGAMPMPSAIGSSTLSTPTSPADLICARTPLGARNSAPTMNMKSTSPSVDSEDSAGSEAGANSSPWNCGNAAPSTIGPSTMPAAISPITGGWPRWRSSRPQMRAVARMIISCSNRGV